MKNANEEVKLFQNYLLPVPHMTHGKFYSQMTDFRVIAFQFV